MSAKQLFIKIVGDAKSILSSLGKTNKGLEEFERKSGAVAKKATARFLAFSASITAVTAGFTNFEDTFTDVVTLLDDSYFKTNDLKGGIRFLKEEVLALGAESGESYEALNKGLFDLVSASGDAEGSIIALKEAAELAQAGATDTSTVVNGMTSAINAYGMSLDESRDVAKKFFAAQKMGKTNIQELSSYMGTAVASADAFGVSLDELLASVSAATLGGISTSSAYTSLTAVLGGLAAPTKKAQDEAKYLGIEFTASALRSKGLAGFLKELSEANGFTKDSVTKLFGSVEAQKIIFALTGKQAGSFKDTLKLLGDEQKTNALLQDALNVKQNTNKAKMDSARRSLEKIAIVFGEIFSPILKEITGSVGRLSERFDNLDEKEIKAIANVILLAAKFLGITATVGLFGVAIAKIVKSLAIVRTVLISVGIAGKTAWTGLLGPIGLVIGAVTLVITYWDDLAGAVSGVLKLTGFWEEDTQAIVASNDQQKQSLDKLTTAHKDYGSIADQVNFAYLQSLQEKQKKGEELNQQEKDTLDKQADFLEKKLKEQGTVQKQSQDTQEKQQEENIGTMTNQQVNGLAVMTREQKKALEVQAKEDEKKKKEEQERLKGHITKVLKKEYESKQEQVQLAGKTSEELHKLMNQAYEDLSQATIDGEDEIIEEKQKAAMEAEDNYNKAIQNEIEAVEGFEEYREDLEKGHQEKIKEIVTKYQKEKEDGIDAHLESIVTAYVESNKDLTDGQKKLEGEMKTSLESMEDTSGKEYTELNKDVDDHKKKVDALKGSVSSLHTHFGNLSGIDINITTLTSKLNSVKGSVNGVAGALSSVNSSLKTFFGYAPSVSAAAQAIVRNINEKIKEDQEEEEKPEPATAQQQSTGANRKTENHYHYEFKGDLLRDKVFINYLIEQIQKKIKFDNVRL